MAVIQLKRSTTAGNVPQSLAAGELALNITDRIAYYNDTNGNLRLFNLTSDTEKVASGAIANAINAKANINSPTFTGTPSGPTQSASDNSNAFATTAFVKTAVSAVGSGATTAVNRQDYRFVATAGQTTYSGTDQNGKTLSYTAGNIFVFYQGALLTPGADYTATNGTSIVLTTLTPKGGEEVLITVLAVAQVPTIVLAQCQLAYTSATAITLNPFNGNQIFINGVNVLIPSAGVALANTGLSASTLYYIYAFMSGSTLTLEASTTAFAINSTYGYMQKSGDVSRTLVGMVYTTGNTPGQFIDNLSVRGVATYYNRIRRPFQVYQSGSSTSSTADGVPCTLLSWGLDAVEATSFGNVGNSGSYSGGLAVFINTASGLIQGYANGSYTQNTSDITPITAKLVITPILGVYTVYPRITAGGGTATFNQLITTGISLQ